MKPWVLRDISEEDQKIFSSIDLLVAQLPDALSLGRDRRGKRIELSCHILTHALANLFPALECVDGYFFRSFEHSWLLTPRYALIDPYPVGIVGGPIMLHDHPVFHLRPSRYLYHRNKEVLQRVIANIGRNAFSRAVEITERELQLLFAGQKGTV